MLPLPEWARPDSYLSVPRALLATSAAHRQPAQAAGDPEDHASCRTPLDPPADAEVGVQEERLQLAWADRGRLRVGTALLGALLLAVAVACAHGLHRAFPVPLSRDPQLIQETSACSLAHNVDYQTEKAIVAVRRVKSAGMCRRKCASTARCGAWTWGSARNVDGVTDVCFLKELSGIRHLRKARKNGVVSGLRPGKDCRAPEDGEKGAVSAPSPAPEPRPGEIQNQHGICLEATKPRGQYARVQMMECKMKFGTYVKPQKWFFHSAIGQIKSEQGLCLHAEDPHEEDSRVIMQWCALGTPNQQWAYDRKTGQIINWHGICMSAPERHVDGSLVVMQTCNMSSPSQQWYFGVPYTYDRWYYDSPTYKEHWNPGTLFCFALMLPNSTEQTLLEMQLKLRVSIFACDGHAVYSNRSIKLGRDLHTHVVDSDLVCRVGGEFRTALNLDIFLRVWKKVISDGQFQQHNWTVKADPDAVFFPSRLRWVLKAHPDTREPVYLNNCKFGMHGPVEVFSRGAVEKWGHGADKCHKHFWKLCKGDCRWGEDMFIDQCLARVLKVRRDNEFRLLVEKHCDPGPDWDSCDDVAHVSFHPFKSPEAYRRCMDRAAAAAAAA